MDIYSSVVTAEGGRWVGMGEGVRGTDGNGKKYIIKIKLLKIYKN